MGPPAAVEASGLSAVACTSSLGESSAVPLPARGRQRSIASRLSMHQSCRHECALLVACTAQSTQLSETAECAANSLLQQGVLLQCCLLIMIWASEDHESVLGLSPVRRLLETIVAMSCSLLPGSCSWLLNYSTLVDMDLMLESVNLTLTVVPRQGSWQANRSRLPSLRGGFDYFGWLCSCRCCC